jgi:nucleotide-binding universal stress UspA family protein
MKTPLKLLVAYDGSDDANTAIDDLMRAGLPPVADALVLTVAEHWAPPPTAFDAGLVGYDGWADAAIRTAEQTARVGCERVSKLFPGWDVRPVGESGSPGRAIVQAAETFVRELIVLGSRGHTALGRILLGSVSDYVATHAPCSVRVSRAREGEGGHPPRILVAVKGAPSSDTALRAVTARSWPDGTEVRLVTAFGPFGLLGSELTSVLAAVDDLHGEASMRLREHGLGTSSVVADGDPKRVLVEMAEQWGADSIVLGTRDLSFKGRMLLGSVSRAVLHRAHCAVEIIRAVD